MLHILRFFSSKCRLFHNATFFGSWIIHILRTECAKIKKNSGAKGLNGIKQIYSDVFRSVDMITARKTPSTWNLS
jgi:hypothetical protein